MYEQGTFCLSNDSSNYHTECSPACCWDGRVGISCMVTVSTSRLRCSWSRCQQSRVRRPAARTITSEYTTEPCQHLHWPTCFACTENNENMHGDKISYIDSRYFSGFRLVSTCVSSQRPHNIVMEDKPYFGRYL